MFLAGTSLGAPLQKRKRARLETSRTNARLAPKFGNLRNAIARLEETKKVGAAIYISECIVGIWKDHFHSISYSSLFIRNSEFCIVLKR